MRLSPSSTPLGDCPGGAACLNGPKSLSTMPDGESDMQNGGKKIVQAVWQSSWGRPPLADTVDLGSALLETVKTDIHSYR